MKRTMLAIAAALSCSAMLAADPAPPSEAPMATVGGAPILRSDVESLVSGEIQKLEDRKQDLLSSALTRKIEQKLLELEAAKTGVTADELLKQEVTAKVTPPTDAEVDAWYESNKGRMNQPKEQVGPQIRARLLEEKKSALKSAYIATLSAKYGVKNDFEKLRSAERTRRGVQLRAIVEKGDHPAAGPAAAPVTIVTFSDFQCPFCSRVLPAVEQVRKDYGDKVRLVFRQYPLGIHANAQKAAEASLCAADQGKFWQMHDAMFADQKGLAVPALKATAVKLGLDAAKFDQCLDSGTKAAEVRADMAEGTRAGVSGTPAFFINGVLISGAQPYGEFKKLVDMALTSTK